MAFWNKNKDNQNTDLSESNQSKVNKKSKVTPKRKTAELYNFNPIIVDRETEKKKRQLYKQKVRQGQMNALKTGDLKNMPEKDQGPDKLLIRAYLDSIWTIEEFFLPIALVMLIFMFIPGFSESRFGVMVTLFVYGFMLVCVIEAAIHWFKIKKLLINRFGNQKDWKLRGHGYVTYMLSRSFQFKVIRLPKRLSKAQNEKILQG